MVLGSLVAVAVGLWPTLTSHRTEVAAATPDPRLPALPSQISRDQAIAVVGGLDAVGRVDRADAKLMSLAEYEWLAGPILTYSGDPQRAPGPGFGITGDRTQRYVWAVAVAGEVWPAGRVPVFFGGTSTPSPTPYPPYRWAIFLVDADPGRLLGVAAAGALGNWATVFDALPSHPARAR